VIARSQSFGTALGIGSAQALALVPGLSRSGAAMGGGLLFGLSNEEAARFAFLLATPIIAAAAALKLPDLLGPQGDGVRGPAFVGALGATLSATWPSACSCATSRPTD
jgi:undecaprenyl-diphosphatase